MKKILLFLLTFLACTYSVKAEWYVVGDFTSWNSSKAFTDNGDGTFTLDYEGTITTSQGFKIYNGSWGNSGDNDSNIFGVSSDGGTVTIGTACTLANPGFNMKLASEVTNPRFVFNPSAKTLLVTAEGSTGDSYPDMKLACDASGWSSTTWVFKDHGDGVWTFTIDDINNFNGTNLAGKPFKILDSDGKWYSFNDFTFNVNDSKTLYKENGNSYFGSTLSGRVTLVLTEKKEDNGNPNIKLLLTDGSLWLRGAWTSDWKTEDPYKFATTDGVTYTLTGVDGATVKGKKWQIADYGWSYKYGMDFQISAADTYTLKYGQSAGFSNDFPDGTYDLVYNYNTHVLVITKQGSTPTPTPTYPDLWVRGGMTNNDWAPTKGYKMTCTDGVYTLENVALSNTEFKIGSDETGKGVDWKYSFGAASGATEVKEVYANGIEDTIYDVERGQNLKIGVVSGTVDITFTPDFKAGKGLLIINPHVTPVVGYKVYVVRPVGAKEIPNIYCYDGFTNGEWPGAAMSRAENDLVLTEGERPIYVYTVESACKVIINTDPSKDVTGPWRYPADQATGVQINEDTIIVISENEKATYGPFDPSKVSGINDVEIFDEAPVEFYNLQGVRVDGELTPGLYIRRQGNSASKVLIR